MHYEQDPGWVWTAHKPAAATTAVRATLLRLLRRLKSRLSRLLRLDIVTKHVRCSKSCEVSVQLLARSGRPGRER